MGGPSKHSDRPSRTSGAAAAWGSGYVVAGRYRLDCELATGGMGSVWRAEHVTLRSPVALKIINPQIAEDEESAARFLREARAAAALRSPHVVQILDFGVHESVPYIAMELLEGESLGDRLERRQRLAPREVSRIIAQVARAVGRAHEAGIVHRDLKPDNIFLVHNADEEVAKVLDFGIAKAAEPLPLTSATRTGAIVGTPHYMSPEQSRGVRDIDFRTDLWSLSVIVYQCITGQLPFDGASLTDVLLRICSDSPPVPSSVADVPAGFDDWFRRGVEREPSRRFDSVKELAEQLRRICEDDAAWSGSGESPIAGASTTRPVAAQSGSLDATLPPPDGKRRRRILALAVLSALAGTGVVALLALRREPARTTPFVSMASAPAMPSHSAPEAEAPSTRPEERATPPEVAIVPPATAAPLRSKPSAAVKSGKKRNMPTASADPSPPPAPASTKVDLGI